MKKGEENIIFSKNKGRKINVWGGINYYGKLSLHLFYENLNSNKYIKILEDALSEMNEINREEKIYLQMDNAKIHWTLDALKFYSENNITVVDWPAYSPDLNPIENIWAYIKSRLSGKRFVSIKQLETELIKIWESISQEQISKTCESIFERIGN